MARKQIRLFDVTVAPQTYRRVRKVLRSGWLTTGPVCNELERRVAAELSVPFALGVSSATHGLEIALAALGVKAKDEVITTAFTFVATSEVIVRRGAIPVYADIDPGTWNMSVKDVERKITSRTACILTVDYGGQLCDYEELRPVAKKHGIPILADASHAFGGKLKQRSSAWCADVAVYSLHSTKNLTSGEGGIAATRAKKLAEKMRTLSKHGMTRNAHERRTRGAAVYDVTELGYKANMSDILAAVALGQLSRFHSDQRTRKKLAARYQTLLAEIADVVGLRTILKHSESGWHLFPVRVLSGEKMRDRVLLAMKRAGIECGTHYKAIPTLEWYKRQPFSRVQLAETEKLSREILTLPLHPGMTISEVDFVVSTLRVALGGFSRR